MNMDTWKEAVGVYNQQREQLRDDRFVIEDRFMKHLRNFFEWDNIYFEENFSKIVLTYAPNINPIIKTNIGELEMEWIVKYGYDGNANAVIRIELYPFGVDGTG